MCLYYKAQDGNKKAVQWNKCSKLLRFLSVNLKDSYFEKTENSEWILPTEVSDKIAKLICHHLAHYRDGKKISALAGVRQAFPDIINLEETDNESSAGKPVSNPVGNPVSNPVGNPVSNPVSNPGNPGNPGNPVNPNNNNNNVGGSAQAVSYQPVSFVYENEKIEKAIKHADKKHRGTIKVHEKSLDAIEKVIALAEQQAQESKQVSISLNQKKRVLYGKKQKITNAQKRAAENMNEVIALAEGLTKAEQVKRNGELLREQLGLSESVSSQEMPGNQ